MLFDLKTNLALSCQVIVSYLFRLKGFVDAGSFLDCLKEPLYLQKNIFSDFFFDALKPVPSFPALTT